jgi:hypothetical protein
MYGYFKTRRSDVNAPACITHSITPKQLLSTL